MTEAEWLDSVDPLAMLDFLEGRIGQRRLRLFACACCRRVSAFFLDKRSLRLIEVSERYADGLSTARKLHAAWQKAEDAWHSIHLSGGGNTDQLSAETVLYLDAELDVDAVLEYAAETMGEAARNAVYESVWKTAGKDHATRAAEDEAAYEAGALKEEAVQAALLREIAGNPFQSITVSPDWLAWNGGTVHTIAEGIYQERAFDRMPILADALEEAGCTEASILGHCRDDAEHVPGCWVLDLILATDR
jgi:hypothetical protein